MPQDARILIKARVVPLRSWQAKPGAQIRETFFAANRECVPLYLYNEARWRQATITVVLVQHVATQVAANGRTISLPERDASPDSLHEERAVLNPAHKNWLVGVGKSGSHDGMGEFVGEFHCLTIAWFFRGGVFPTPRRARLDIRTASRHDEARVCGNEKVGTLDRVGSRNLVRPFAPRPPSHREVLVARARVRGNSFDAGSNGNMVCVGLATREEERMTKLDDLEVRFQRYREWKSPSFQPDMEWLIARCRKLERALQRISSGEYFIGVASEALEED